MKVKNKTRVKIAILSICFIVFGILFYFAQSRDGIEELHGGVYFERGRVIRVVSEEVEPFRQQILEIEVLSSEFEGLIIEATNNLMDHTLRAFDAGDRVSLSLSDTDFMVIAPDRSYALIGFVVLFLVALASLGGKRGVMSILGLLFSLAAIVLLLIPLTLAGYPPILLTVGISVLITIVDVTLIAGVNAKSFSTILGSISGLLVAAIFAFLAGEIAFVTGYHTEQAGMLMSWGPDITLSGIFVSGVIISAMGAITDTAMAISSSMEEVKRANPEISGRALFKAGFNVGRDAMGTMSNTLILAFVGSGFSLMLFIFAMNTTWNQFINSDLIGVEVVQGMAGSLGIVLTVPITTFIAAKLFLVNSNVNEHKKEIE